MSPKNISPSYFGKEDLSHSFINLPGIHNFFRSRLRRRPVIPKANQLCCVSMIWFGPGRKPSMARMWSTWPAQSHFLFQPITRDLKWLGSGLDSSVGSNIKQVPCWTIIRRMCTYGYMKWGPTCYAVGVTVPMTFEKFLK